LTYVVIEKVEEVIAVVGNVAINLLEQEQSYL
jgi:hypothetical protein